MVVCKVAVLFVVSKCELYHVAHNTIANMYMYYLSIRLHFLYLFLLIYEMKAREMRVFWAIS